MRFRPAPSLPQSRLRPAGGALGISERIMFTLHLLPLNFIYNVSAWWWGRLPAQSPQCQGREKGRSRV